MSRKYLLFLPFCFVVLFFSAALIPLSSIVTVAQAETTKSAWQDPFYTGPFGVRIWTDITGDHRVEARFVELLPDKIVRLQRPDGRFLRINLDELSSADRQLVQQIAKK